MNLKYIYGVVLLLMSSFLIGQDIDDVKVYVNGNCSMCKSNIETAAMSSPGVIHASWDAKTKALNIVFNQEVFDMDATLINIGNAGYDNQDYIASDEVYNALPLCCQYREKSDVDLDEYHKNKSKKKNNRQFLRGVVYDKEVNGEKQSLPGVHVYYLGKKQGVMTDERGLFSLPLKSNKKESIIVSYLGYQNDTIEVASNDWVEITLQEGVMMNEVVIRHRKMTTEYSFINPIKVESISQGELEKAACCNLSESFTTNASIDDTATDAVTGTRQIQLLGLASPYVQITLENVPYIRGLSAISGFELVPGPWIKGMQLNTGAGSASDGFEAMTGQINVDYKEPDTDEKLFVNLYSNISGAFEANVISRVLNTDRASSSILLHSKYRSRENDGNDDGFLDAPITKHLFLTNKWKFSITDSWKARMTFSGAIRDAQAGQLETISSNPWEVSKDEQKFDAVIKSGKVLKKNKSLGFIASGSFHNQSADYGNKLYEGDHNYFFGNFLYENIIGSPNHKYRLGLNLQADIMEERISGAEMINDTYNRNTNTIGLHGEYTFKLDDVFSAVVGMRGDIHNKYGFFFTPKLHLRYMPTESLVFRLAAGKGTRTASIFAENPSIFVSNRTIIVEGDNSDDPYGLQREESWTYGGNVSYQWDMWGRESLLSSDYYVTDFQERVIVDWDNPREVRFYMLDGTSFSKSFKTQWDIELIDKLDMRLAYRYNDVQTDYQTENGIERREQAMNSKHRFFVNFGYSTDKEWKFDMTLNRQGSRRLPITASNPVDYRLDAKSPAYYTLAAQVSKTWGDWEVYFGGENLTNYKQDNPIISADDPWNEHFDASIIWAPIFGRNLYLGMRYTLKDAE